jgi:glycosyltransferase involved in cell wall biosynthesis
MMDLWATVPYYTAYLSRALLERGVRLTVGSISYYLDPDCFSSRGLKVDPGLSDVVGKFPLSRAPRRVFKMLEAMLNLAALTVRFLVSPPDVVHVQYLPMLQWRLPLDFWFLEFCRSRGVKIVLTVHDLLPHDSGAAYRQTFHKLYWRADRIICHSEHVRARLGEEFCVLPEKISVVPHGPFFYDLPPGDGGQTLRQLQIAPEDLVVLWQGIVFPYKGLDLLVEAWQSVQGSGVDATLVIAGTGTPELLEQVRQQVCRLGLRRVKLELRFISTEELVTLYRTAAIVVYPYREITTSGALATGLALGKTIVASDLPVFRELLINRKNALLVDPHSSRELAEALLELIRDPALRQQLAAQVGAMNFGDRSWISIADKTIEAYGLALARP